MANDFRSISGQVLILLALISLSDSILILSAHSLVPNQYDFVQMRPDLEKITVEGVGIVVPGQNLAAYGLRGILQFCSQICSYFGILPLFPTPVASTGLPPPTESHANQVPVPLEIGSESTISEDIGGLWIHSALPVSQSAGTLSNGTIIEVVLGIAGLCKLLISIVKVSLERWGSKRSEKQLIVILGFLGFLLGLAFLFEVIRNWVFGVGFQSFDPFWNIIITVFMGCIAGFLFMPAARSARAFWLGTNQIRCNLSIIYCGLIGRMLPYANYFLIIFTSWLLINPLTDILMNKHISGRRGSLNANDQLVGNLGMSRSDFDKFRVWCLFGSRLLQILALCPNLQMFLNEAVLCWYQRLHASKVSDLGFSRAKVFLHSHYLCAVVLQFYVPPAMVLIFLGFSQIHDSMFKNFQPVCILVKQVAFFMAWWINFVWAIFTSTSLIQYRCEAWYVS